MPAAKAAGQPDREHVAAERAAALESRLVKLVIVVGASADAPLRVSLGYEFINRLWLLGGVDDMLSGARRDYFVGAQLRFNDEDLKKIIPFVPAQ